MIKLRTFVVADIDGTEHTIDAQYVNFPISNGDPLTFVRDGNIIAAFAGGCWMHILECGDPEDIPQIGVPSS